MIHTIDTLTIRRYGEIDRTGNLSLLKRWWNVFPVGWFDTEHIFIYVRELLGENVDNTINNEIYKTIAYNNILILDACLKTIKLLMENQNDRSFFRLVFNKKNADFSLQLNYYIDKVYKLTGIKIIDGKQLEKLAKEINRRIDKYNERFKSKQKQKTIDFIDIVLGVFSIVGMNYNPDMVLSEFGRLKIKADNILAQQKKQTQKKHG